MKKWNYRQHLDDERFEKVGKMRTRSRRAQSSKQNLDQDFMIKEEKWPSLEGGFAARIVEVHKRSCFISPEPVLGEVQTHDVWIAHIAGRYYTADRSERNFFCVGDRVYCRPADAKEMDQNSDLPQATIVKMAPRMSKIARQDPMYPHREHVLASNMTQLVVVASYLSPRIKWGLIDRYLVLAELQDLPAVIVLNKTDLLSEAEPDFAAQCRERREVYRNLGYSVIEVQANASRAASSSGIKELKSLMKDKISILSGHSGVGKSSLVNLMAPDLEQAVEENDDIFYKGRHTTSYASFLGLGIGGYVIDTPGIRSFVVSDFSSIELSHGFKDIRPFATHCKFRECRHIDEPGCAVLDAVKDKKIADWRYKNYQGILLGTTGREGRKRQHVEETEILDEES